MSFLINRLLWKSSLGTILLSVYKKGGNGNEKDIMVVSDFIDYLTGPYLWKI